MGEIDLKNFHDVSYIKLLLASVLVHNLYTSLSQLYNYIKNDIAKIFEYLK